MEKREFCVLIKHYFLRSKTFKESADILWRLVLSHGILHKWFTEFHLNHKGTKDAPRKFKWWVKVREIDNMAAISNTVIQILHDHLGLMQVSVKWVQSLLTDSAEDFETKFETSQTQFKYIFTPFRNIWWILDIPLHAKNKGPIETVDFSKWVPQKS